MGLEEHACEHVLKQRDMCTSDMYLQPLLDGQRYPRSAWSWQSCTCHTLQCCLVQVMRAQVALFADAGMFGCCRLSWRRSSRQRAPALTLKQRAPRWQSCRAPCTARRAQMRPSIAWWSCCTSQRWVSDVSPLQAPFPCTSGPLLPAMGAFKARPLQQYCTGTSIAWN